MEVIRHYLNSTAEQMRRTLVRTAFNPVIYEVLDFGISMYDRDRRLISESSGLLSFLGANDYAIHKGVEKVGIENLYPGDVVMLNYPYWSGAHVSDAMLFAPVFFRREVMLPDAYLAVRAHWMDLGAKDPGYVLDSTSMHQEGLIMPGVKVINRGVVDRQMIDILRYNSRMPDTIIGDFNAQVAALRVGERRLHQIWEKFGLATVDAAINLIINHGADTATEAVRSMPDGRWSAADWLDDDGISHDLIKMAGDGDHRGDPVHRGLRGLRRSGPGAGEHAVREDSEHGQGGVQVSHHSRHSRQPRPLPTARGDLSAGQSVPRRLSRRDFHALDRHGGLRTGPQGAGQGDGAHSRLLGCGRARVHGGGNPSRDRGVVCGQQQRGDRLGSHPAITTAPTPYSIPP